MICHLYPFNSENEEEEARIFGGGGRYHLLNQPHGWVIDLCFTSLFTMFIKSTNFTDFRAKDPLRASRIVGEI